MADLIIIGASVRAAAQSAIRAGLTPWCADLFCDADLLRSVPDAVQLPFADYPDGFLKLFDQAPNVPWMYTGGLENYPELIDQLAAKRPLWGNSGAVLRRVRDPFYLEQILLEANLPVLEVRHAGTPLPDDRLWLRKPLQGSAGQGIAFAQYAYETVGTCYYQEFKDGVPMSAIYVAEADDVYSFGATKQLIGTSWLNANEFHYAGNIGPIDLALQWNTLQHIAETLVSRCGLKGLFGIDFILAKETPYLVEVNPRYTASVEVLEGQDSFLDLIASHANAFNERVVKVYDAFYPPPPPLVGKAILYASRPITITDTLAKQLHKTSGIADIPKRGDIIQAGWPILTVFADGNTDEECETRLRERAAELYRLLEGPRRV